MDVSQFPLVGNIKITGVNAAIGFKNELALAGTKQAAHFMRYPHCHSDQIVEIPYTDFSATHEISTPIIKEAF